jgi:hypothetical protein
MYGGLPDPFGDVGGIPTALWFPQVQTRDGSFGVRTNQFGFNVNWTSGQTAVVESCDTLSNPVWSPLQTNIFIGNSFYFSDPQWTNHPSRFYRVVTPQDLIGDLVAHWVFSGNANDQSPYSNDGDISSAIFLADRHGNAASALGCNGSFVDVPSSPSLDMTNGISISLWINPNSLQGAMLIGKSDYSSRTDYVLRVLAGGDLQWEYKYYHETTTHPITAGQWHHVVVTAQSPTGAKQIFVDGAAVSFNQTTTSGEVSTVPERLTIGYAGYGSELFDGAIDDVRMYKRALNATEAITIYDQEK